MAKFAALFSFKPEVTARMIEKPSDRAAAARDLAKSIGLDDIDAVAKHAGMSRDELLSGLRRELPNAVDQLTPEGRLPTKEEAQRWV